MIRTKIQLRFNDMDMLGHLYNGQYQHLYDIAKSDYFDRVMGVSASWYTTGEAFLTATTTSTYYVSVELQEPIVIETLIEKIGTKSFTIYQRMLNEQTGELKSDSRTTMVCFNNLTKQTKQMPDKWREKIIEQGDLAEAVAF